MLRQHLDRSRAPVVLKLELDAEIPAFQQLDDRLQVVPVFAGHPDLFSLDRRLHLDL